MKVLFTTIGSPSHGRGQLPLARACAAAGHEVLVATMPSVAPVFEHDDVRVNVCLDDFSPQSFLTPDLLELAKVPGEEVMQRDALERIFPLTMAGPLAEHLLESILPVARSFGPDLILRDGMDLSSCLTAEHLGIPQLPTPSGVTNVIDPVDVLPRLNGLRAAQGLPALDDPMSIMPHGRLDCVPAAFSFAPNPPPRFVYRQAATVDRAAVLPQWIADLPADRPLVFASLGTAIPLIHQRSADIDESKLTLPLPVPDPVALLGSVVDAMAELRDCTVIVATLGLDVTTTVPGHVHITNRVPQPLLLECADLFLTHGGFNSIRESLRTGTPMIVLPQFGDQFANAARVEQLGLGREIPGETPAVIADTARAVLADHAIHTRARQARLAMLALPEVDTTVTDLETITRS